MCVKCRQDFHLPESSRTVWKFVMKMAKQNLVGGFQPFEKILVKLDHFPRDRGENKKIFELPPPRNRSIPI